LVQKFTRKLAAILSADVVGYSRLIRADEEGTLLALQVLRKEVIDPKITQHRGRIVKLMGDGILVEFTSVVDAVACGAEIQQAIRTHNIAGPEIIFRMGINLGDVIIDGDDIQGDGINVAARLEALSEPGGMCISEAVHEQVRDRLNLKFESMGAQQVKNIDRAVQAWKWYASQRNFGDDFKPNFKNAAMLAQDRPSIAVLPFNNMSSDSEQEYFADGVVEEIITSLAKSSWLFVIARNSSFIYKGRAVDIKTVGQELGVRYVLEGSIRKAKDKIRLTGQLIDATTGTHLWADRYDGSLEDIFELQDKITSSVVGAISPKLEAAEIERTKHKPTSSLDAYDCYLRGMAAMHKWSAAGLIEATSYFYRAIEIDSGYGIAYAMAARCLNIRLVTIPLEFSHRDITEASRLCGIAADLGRNDALALCMAGVTLGFAVRDVHGGAALTTRALTLNPNLAAAWLSNGWLQQWLGYPEIAIEHIGRSIELSPQDPAIFQMQSAMSAAYFTADNDLLALSWAEKALYDRTNHFPALTHALVSAAHLGLQAKTDEFRNRILRLFPEIRLKNLAHMIPYQLQEHQARFLSGLQKAKFPE
jgi:TolB-like protein/class 3 adenylate cyclase